MFNNQLNQSTNKLILSVGLLHTKSIHTPYTVSGIIERSENEKSPNTICIKAFKCGVDETRTRDLLRDRQEDFLILSLFSTVLRLAGHLSVHLKGVSAYVSHKGFQIAILSISIFSQR